VKFDLTLGLVDRPGQLLTALEPIAKHGGNIISILHDREEASGGYVPVSLVVDFPSNRNFERAKKELENLGVSIIKSEEIIEKANITFILVGRLDVSRISEMETEGVRIVDFEVSAPTSKEACIRLNVEAPAGEASKIVERLKELARKEEALLISSV